MASNKLTRFENCRILRNGEIVENDYLLIRDGKIVDYMKVFFDERVEPEIRIDCKGALLSPGLIDIQVNGGFGYDFANNVDNVEEGLRVVSEGLLQYGVTGFCPTLVSSSPDVYKKVLPKISATTGAINLGVHVEGPFVSKSRVGAHVVENLRTLEGGLTSVEEMYGSLDNIKIITLAPEIDGALDTIKQLTDRGIIVSMGHSDTNLGTAKLAVKNGASLITHLFNAMTPFHHRDPGLLGLLATEREGNPPIYFGLINDGCHTHPEAVRIVYRTNYEGLVLVTDAISAIGLEDGIHRIGPLEIEIKDKCAYILGTKTLCGSITSLNKCVQLLDEYTNCGKVQAVEAASLHPAQVLGIADRKGTLNPGADADIVFFDDNFDVLSTWIGGRCFYERSPHSFEVIE